MKKLLGIFIALMVVLGMAGQGLADFTTNAELIRVVYATTGSTAEAGTELGVASSSYSSDAILGGTVSLSQLGTGLNNLVVTYEAKAFGGPATAKHAWVSGGVTGAVQSISADGAYTGFNSGVNLFTGYYAGLGTGTVVGDKTAQNSFNSVMAPTGSFAGLITSPNGSEISLAALAATGYVDQKLYYFGSPNAAGDGQWIATLRTFLTSDGQTVNTAGTMIATEIMAPSAVPIPAAVWLLGLRTPLALSASAAEARSDESRGIRTRQNNNGKTKN